VFSPPFITGKNVIESEFPISIPFLRKTIRPPLSRVNLKSRDKRGSFWRFPLTLWHVTWLDAGTPHGMMIPQRSVRISPGSLSDRQRQRCGTRNMLPKHYRVRTFRPAAASNSAHASPAVCRRRHPAFVVIAAVAKSRSLGQTEKAIAVPIIFLRVTTKPSFRIHTKDLLQWTVVAARLSMGNLKRLPRQCATVSNEIGSELGPELRGDSDNATRQR